jgi:UPF0755 protein
MAQYYLRLCKYICYISLVAVIYLITSGYVFLNSPISSNIKNNSNGILIEITKGSSLKLISNRLFQQGIIQHPNYFLWYAKLKNIDTKIKFGEYLIFPYTTPKSLLQDLFLGNVHKYRFTIIEGWKFSDLQSALLKAEKLEKTTDYVDLMLIKGSKSFGKHLQNLEGIFYPDTYYYAKGTSDIELLNVASDKLLSELNNMWKHKSENIFVQTPYESLILASIIEKESGYAAELGKISGVYTRRLITKMKLQADPTVVYAMGDSYKGKLYYKDLKLDSPYNTYINQGLPPTPISFPSKLALLAALNPAEGDELYFVADGNGKHIFSKDLVAHTAATEKIRDNSKVIKP